MTCGTMVSAAQANQIFEYVLPPDCARDQMVHINRDAVPTTSHYAAPAISTPHLPTQSGRDRLRRSLGTALGLACPLIATTETLSVALAHFDHLGPNLAAD